MTTEHEATRTLVKSPPELWAECSQAQSLARHLAGSFGEIRITRLEPETAVAWEGEHASGTVRIEPSGWGTRVTLTAQPLLEPVIEDEPAPIVETADDAASPSAEAPAEPPRRRLLDRLRALFRGPEPPAAEESVAIPEAAATAPEPDPEPEPEPVAPDPPAPDPGAVLTAALDSLGQAHHRPFSRA